MTESRFAIVRLVLRSAAFLLALNEIRGIVLAVPVLYAMYEAGGTLMAIWLGFCSLAGIALSVIVPMFAIRKLERRLQPA
ncbi:hypothetical protein [Aurantiacibacter luteus]|uniref:Uncharacterized protein n=1 Tax=Aurantiacibacter luteus TaxID=1581420 RepID=A0A0G9MKM6_9SPHN|nr:hypothetical protein [Aurantiacibacter luteus]KLE31240.1 hypothetical protein AAW00_13815 [Aurantiacibacter luteus]